MRTNPRVVVVVWPIGRVPRAIGRRGIGRVALGGGERERAGGGGARRRRGGRSSAAPHVVVHPRQRRESGPGLLGRGGRLLLPRAGRRRGDREEAGDAGGNPRGSAVGPAACDRQRVARRRGRVPASVDAGLPARPATRRGHLAQKLGRHPSSVGVGEVGAPGRADDGEAGLALARGQRLDSERVYLQTRGDGKAGGKGRVTRGAPRRCNKSPGDNEFGG